MHLLKMVKRKWKRVGMGGIFVDLFKNIASIADRKSRRIDMAGRAFDDQLGIETTDYVPVSSFDVSEDDFLKAFSYRPTPVTVFGKIMKELHIDFSKFCFVDFGSGKGRTLIMASQYPFGKIRGVELTRNLHEIANNNIDRFKKEQTMVCSDVQSVLCNATTYQIPEEPCIFYFFNPFSREVMTDVVKNITQSLTEKNREAYLIYLKPLYPEAIESETGFKRITTIEFEEYSNPCYFYAWQP